MSTISISITLIFCVLGDISDGNFIDAMREGGDILSAPLRKLTNYTKLFSLHTLDCPAVTFSSVVTDIYEMFRTTTLMIDDKAIELVKPNPHIFTEIIPRHPDWWILTVDIKHNQD